MSAQIPRKRETAIEAATKMIWNAFSDIFLLVLRGLLVDQSGRIVHQAGWLQRTQGKIHQPCEEENGGNEDRVNHDALADQVHEKAGHEETFDSGDDEREDDVAAVADVDVRRQNGDDGADYEGRNAQQ